jgi:hypothetical protein
MANEFLSWRALNQFARDTKRKQSQSDVQSDDEMPGDLEEMMPRPPVEPLPRQGNRYNDKWSRQSGKWRREPAEIDKTLPYTPGGTSSAEQLPYDPRDRSGPSAEQLPLTIPGGGRGTEGGGDPLSQLLELAKKQDKAIEDLTNIVKEMKESPAAKWGA